MTVRTLLIDNYDSFTYNLYSMLCEVNGVEPVVVRNDVDWDSLDLAKFDNIVVSPGPGRPSTSHDLGISARAIVDSDLPILGVCLGHQAICHLLGGEVDLAPEPMHGRISEIVHDGVGLFDGIPSPYSVVRYHSLTAMDLPDELEACAWTADGIVMAVRHRSRPMWGVQFHPESVSTEYGRELLSNFRDLTRSILHPFAAPTRTPYFLESQCIEGVFDTEQVFGELFATGPNTFWLDGSSAVEPDSRFTIMGDCSGPLAEYITYRVAERRVEVSRADGTTESVDSTFFDYLDRQLKARAVHARHDLPFAFALGYVGYLGYELKADVGGQLVHTAPTPDASMVFADRALVFDHESGCCYAMALVEEHGDPATATWFEGVVDALTSLREGAHSSQPQESPLFAPEFEQDLQLRHDREKYLGLIEQCLAEIRSGETYEVCLTNVASFPGPIDALDTYSYLREINPTPYSAFLGFTDLSISSASPERFLRIDADRVVESKPIKGTRPPWQHTGTGFPAAGGPSRQREGQSRKSDDRGLGAKRSGAGVCTGFGARTEAVRRRDVCAGAPACLDRARPTARRRLGGGLHRCGIPRRIDDGCPENQDDGHHRQARRRAARRVFGCYRLLLADRNRGLLHRDTDDSVHRARGDLRCGWRDRRAIGPGRRVSGDDGESSVDAARADRLRAERKPEGQVGRSLRLSVPVVRVS